MKLTVCDICLAKPAAPIRLRNGNTQSGPDGLEDCTDYFELCLIHMTECATELARGKPEQQEKVCAMFRRRIKAGQ